MRTWFRGLAGAIVVLLTPSPAVPQSQRDPVRELRNHEKVNAFGGYTTVLALAFMLLVLLYSTLAAEHFGYLIVAFFAAFSLVLSHQLAAFLAIFIMPPVLIFMLIKSRGSYLKVIIALVLGG